MKIENANIRIAVPVTSDNGLQSPISGHFGKAPGFLTVNMDGSGVAYLDSATSRAPSECAPVSALAAASVQIVVARSMGRGALNRCHQAGMRIYQTEAESVGDLLDELSAGIFVDFPDAALCHHHAHHNDECHPHE